MCHHLSEAEIQKTGLIALPTLRRPSLTSIPVFRGKKKQCLKKPLRRTKTFFSRLGRKFSQIDFLISSKEVKGKKWSYHSPPQIPRPFKHQRSHPPLQPLPQTCSQASHPEVCNHQPLPQSRATHRQWHQLSPQLCPFLLSQKPEAPSTPRTPSASTTKHPTRFRRSLHHRPSPYHTHGGHWLQPAATTTPHSNRVLGLPKCLRHSQPSKTTCSTHKRQAQT